MVQTNSVDYNCPLTTGSYGARGVTYWGPGGTFGLSPNGGAASWTFTCTRPRCYQNGGDNTNVKFTFQIDANSSNADVGPLALYLNSHDMHTPMWHSRIVGHDATVAIDLNNSGWFNDSGFNTLTFYNQDSQRTMYIANTLIKRVYYNCAPQVNNTCTNPPNSSGNCENGTTAGSSGNLDSTRVDYPCNCPTHGGRSYVMLKLDGDFTSLSSGASTNCTFTNGSNPSRPSNYVNRDTCLFNLNQVGIGSNSTADDVPFTLTINNQWGPTYYHSKVQGHNIFPTLDLADGTYGGLYNDTGTNTVRITNNGNVSLLSDANHIDIYRIYRTSQSWGGNPC